MSNILLIQPTTTALDLKKDKPSAPFGLLSAVRLLEKNVTVRLLDERLDKPFAARLQKALLEKPLFVGVTSIAGPMIRHALAITGMVREFSPETKVVWGGPHSLVAGELAIRSPLIDAVVVCEGEETLPRLCEAFLENTPLSDIKGLWLKDENGGPFFTGHAPMQDLSSLPPVSYRLAGNRYFFGSQGRPTAFFETSRGCPYSCRYCYQSIAGRPWRAASPEWVQGALAFLLDENPEVRHLYVADDNYFFDTDRTSQITRGLLEAGKDLTYQVQGASLVDLLKLSDRDIKELRRSGCVRLDIGAESGSPRMSAVLGKKVQPQALLDLAGRLAKKGIIPWINLVLGFPGESNEDIERSLDHAMDLVEGIPSAMVSPIAAFYPYPGTRLFDESLKLGFQPPESIADVASSDWRVPRTPWLSRKKRVFLERLNFYTIVIDQKIPLYRSGLLTRLAHRLFMPLARLRIKKRLFFLPIEKWLFEAINGRDY